MKKALIGLALAAVVFSQGCASMMGASKYQSSIKREARRLQRDMPTVATSRQVEEWLDYRADDRPALRGAVSVEQWNGVNHLTVDLTKWDAYCTMWAENPGEAALRTLVDVAGGALLTWGGVELVENLNKPEKVTNNYTQNAFLEGDGDIDQTAGDGNTDTKGDRSSQRVTNPFLPPAAE